MRRDGDRAAFVTGGGSGIGRAAAFRFADAGAAVAVIDLDGTAAEETAAKVRADGGEAMALIADIADAAAVERAVRATVAAFGRLDWAFNNAGVAADRRVRTIGKRRSWPARSRLMSRARSPA